MLFFAVNVTAQSPLKIAQNDSVVISNLNKKALDLFYSDTNRANQVVHEAEKIARKNPKSYGYAEVVFTRAAIGVLSARKDSTYYYCQKALQLCEQGNFKSLRPRCINCIGLLKWNQGEFDSALRYFFKALELSESITINKKKNQSLFLNNIGLIFVEKKMYAKGLTYFKKSYQLRIEDKLIREQATSLNNIGICYMNLKKTDFAIKTFQRGLQIAQESNDLIMYYKILHNLSNLYADNRMYQKAIQGYLEVLHKPKEIVSNPRDLMILYGCISNTYAKVNEYENAYRYASNGLDLIQKDAHLEAYADNVYNALSKYYFHKNQIKLGDYYLTKHYELEKHLFAEESSLALAQMEIKYQSEKKEKELFKARAESIAKKAELKKREGQMQLAWMVILGLIVIIYLVYLQKNTKIKQQKEAFRLKSEIEKMEMENQLQNQRLEISRNLHDTIGSQLTFIVSSVDNIQNAFPIQDSKLESKLQGIADFTQSTIMELRDTIWAMNTDTIKVEDLKIRIANFIDKVQFSNEKIAFYFIADEEVDVNTSFSTVEGMNVYRIIQEAVHNAYKYANAKNITVSISKVDQGFQWKITDDGVGFLEDSIVKGNGIKNMRKRAQELGYDFELVSKIGNGTAIVLTKNKRTDEYKNSLS